MSLGNIIIIIITTIVERIRNVDRLYWTRSWRTHFGVSVNVLEIGGKNLNITLTFSIVIINVRRDSLITCITILYNTPFPHTHPLYNLSN